MHENQMQKMLHFEAVTHIALTDFRDLVNCDHYYLAHAAVFVSIY